MTPPKKQAPSDTPLVDRLARSMVLLHGGHDDQDDHHHGTDGHAGGSWSKAPDFASDPQRAAAVHAATERPHGVKRPAASARGQRSSASRRVRVRAGRRTADGPRVIVGSLRDAVQSSPNIDYAPGVRVVGVDGTVLYTNLAVDHALGYPPDSLVGRSVLTFVHPDDAPLAPKGLS